MNGNRELLVTLGLNTDSFTYNLKRSRDLLKESESDFMKLGEVVDLVGNDLEKLGLRQQQLTKNLEIMNAQSTLYSDRMSETKIQLSEQEEVYQKLNASLKEQFGNIDENTKLNKEQAKEYKSLTQQISKTEQSIRKYNKRLLDCETGYNKLRKDIIQTVKAIEECNVAFDGFDGQEKMATLNEEIEKVSNDLEQARYNLVNFGQTYESIDFMQDSLNKNLRSQNEIMDVTATEISRIKNGMAEYSESITSAQLMIASLVKEQEKLSTSTKNGQKIFNSYEKDIQDLEEETGRYIEKMNLSQDQLSKLSSSYDKASIEVGKMKSQLQELSNQQSKLDDAFSFSKANKSIRQMSEDTLEKLNLKLKDIKLGFKTASDGVLGFDKSAEGLSTKIKTLNKEITNMSKQQDEWTKINKNAQVSMGGYARVIKKLEQQILENNENIKTSDARTKDALRNENLELMANLEQMQEKLAEERTAFDNSKSSIYNCKTSLSSLNQEVLKTKNSLSEMVEGASSLDILDEKIKSLGQASLENLNLKLKELDNNFDVLKGGSKDFGKSLETLESTLENLENKFELVGTITSQYEDELSAVSNKVQSLTEKKKALIQTLIQEKDALKNLNGSELDTQIEKIEQLEEEYKELNSSLDDSQKYLKETAQNYDKNRIELSKLGNELVSTKEKLKTFSNTESLNKLGSNLEIIDSRFEMLSKTLEIAKEKSKLFGLSWQSQSREIANSKEQLSLMNEKLLNYSNSLGIAKDKNSILKESQAELNAQIEKTKDNLLIVNTAFGENSKQALSLKSTLLGLSESFEKVNEDIEKSEIEINKFATQVDETSLKIKNLNKSLNTNRFSAMGSGLSNFGSKIKGVGSSIDQLGYKFMGLSATATMGMGAIIKTGAEFEQSMANLSAVLGIQKTSEAYKQLSQASEEYGRTSIYSSKEVSEGLLEIAQNGFSAKQSLAMLPTTLKSAQASGMSLAQTSELCITALDTLGHRGADSTQYLARMMNDLSVTANNSSGNIQDLLEGISQGGGFAKEMGINVEQLSAMLGILADGGVKSATAGRNLNSVLINMVRNTGQGAIAMKDLSKRIGLTHNLMFDASGKILPITKSIVLLRKALSGLTQQQQIDMLSKLGGKTQISSLLKLVNGMTTSTGQLSDKYVGLMNDMKDPSNKNALEDMSKTMTNTFEGQAKMLKANTMQTMVDIFTAMKPTLTSILKTINGIVTSIDKWVRSLSPLEKNVFSKIFIGAVALAPSLLALGTAFKLVGVAVTGLSLPLKGIGKILQLLGLKSIKTVSGAEKVASSITKVGESVGESSLGIESFVGSGEGLVATLGSLSAVALPVGVAVATVGASAYLTKKSVDLMNTSASKSADDMGFLSRQILKIDDAYGMSNKQLVEYGIQNKKWGSEMSTGTKTALDKTASSIATFNAKLEILSRNNPSVAYTKEQLNSMATYTNTLLQNTLTSIKNNAPKIEAELKKGFISDNGVLTENQKEILKSIEKYNTQQETDAKTTAQKINDIRKAAALSGNKMTKQEYQEIADLTAHLGSIQYNQIVKGNENTLKNQAVFINKMRTLDINGVGDLLKTQATARDKELKIIDDKYDTQIAYMKLIRPKLDKQGQKEVDSQIKILTDAKYQAESVQVEKYKGFLKIAEKKYPELGKYIDEETGVQFTRQQQADQKQLDQQTSQWDGLNQITHSGCYELYNKVTKSWEKTSVQVDTKTGKIVGVWKKGTSTILGDPVKAKNMINPNTYTKSFDKISGSWGDNVTSVKKNPMSVTISIPSHPFSDLWSAFLNVKSAIESDFVTPSVGGTGDVRGLRYGGGNFMVVPNKTMPFYKNKELPKPTSFAVRTDVKASEHSKTFNPVSFAIAPSSSMIDSIVEIGLKNMARNLDMRDYKTNGGYYERQPIVNSQPVGGDLIEMLIKNQAIMMQLLTQQKVTNVNFAVGSKKVAQACFNEVGNMINGNQLGKNYMKGLI